MSLEDRLAIEDVIKRYCLAIDRADRAGLEAVFTDDAIFCYGAFCQPIAEYLDVVMAIKQAVPITQHVLSNCLVEITGETARCTASYTAYHDVPAGADAPPPFNQLPERTDAIVAGSYEDHLIYGAQGWRIQNRTTAIVWQRWTPPAPHPGGWR